MSYSAFFLLSMKSHTFASFFNNVFAGERQHLLSGLRGAIHEVPLMHEECWVRFLWILASWQNRNDMCDNQQGFVPEQLQKLPQRVWI